VVGQLEKALNRVEELTRPRFGLPTRMQVRSADIADEE
jgi:hypothetical protein